MPDAAAPEKEAAREPEAPPAVTEEPANDPPAAPLPAADDATGPEAAGGPVAVAPPGPASAPAESVGSGDSSQPPASSEGITPMAHPALHSSQFQCQHCSLGGDPAAP